MEVTGTCTVRGIVNGVREVNGWVKVPVRDIVVEETEEGKEEAVRYCWTWPDLKLNISRSLERLGLLP